ncbi:MAG: T9SS type A sorting domain-containing protein [Bacteroidia bacterium]
MEKMITKSVLSLACLMLLGATGLYAKENIGQKRANEKGMRTSANCAPASSSVELDINNVRALIHNGGDFWWDLVGNPRYEVPKLPRAQAASARHSSFAGSLWIGGIDESGQLRVAAQTYRQGGNDFWPGPLTAGGATIDDVTCSAWDDHYLITKEEISAARAAYLDAVTNGGTFNVDLYPAVKSWPAFGEDADGNRLSMAPFVDVDGDPLNYTPSAGDYPDISPTAGGGSPDQAIWWVINDKGDVHTETGGEAIGLEIQMLAFAFATTDQVNDMTFYKYKVVNKSTLRLNNTYMGQWVDSDVGNYSDDYVGCDVSRGLGFAYNGDANDETAAGYGANPPSFGLDFFQGPYGDSGDRLDMGTFVYYENDFSLRGNPEVATHFYGYLRGYWKDGSHMVDNGQNGYPGTAAGPETQFMYPGDPGFCGGGGNGGWSEVTAGNQPFDRRFLQSAGPFTLQPGAVNDIVVGAVWARGYYNDQLGSVCELFTADDIAQSLFDNNFKLLDGPDAPELTIDEYDQELLVKWDYSNQDVFNNYHESYLQADPALKAQGLADSLFAFEGYLIYQLVNASVSANDVFDTDKARIVAQCDLKNGVSTIVNRTSQSVSGLTQPIIVDVVMVQGADEGVTHSVRVTEDLFATGADRRLKNYTTYYYGSLAYAYNAEPSGGRRFVQGNRFFKNTAAVPHKIDFEGLGTVVNSDYDTSPEITQIAGVGNGGHFVDLTAASINDILANDSVASLTYQSGKAPITVKVVNPKEVHAGNYRLEVVGKSYVGETFTIRNDSVVLIDSTFADWELYEGGNLIYQSTYIQRTQTGVLGTSVTNRPEPVSGIERLIPEHGISVAVGDVIESGDTLIDGVIGATMTFDDPLQTWLFGVPDQDGFDAWDWILSGDKDTDRGHSGNAYKVNRVFDKEEHFEALINGMWGPFCMARQFVNDDAAGDVRPGVDVRPTNSGFGVSAATVTNLSQLPDVDVVFTSDVSKWSKCVVIETSPGKVLGSGAWPMAARWDYPIVNAGDTARDFGADLVTQQGMSWFPGYAIDVNTGRRLNIFFGESSWDRDNNGYDMLWNPTSSFGATGTNVGGRHFVYVTRQTYDECAYLYNFLSNGTLPTAGTGSLLFLDQNDPNTDMREAYKLVAWVGCPMLYPGYSFKDPKEIPTNATIKLRVNQPIRSRGGTTDYPIFTWSTDDLAAEAGVTAVAQNSLLNNVRVVPNPYYGFSTYERSQLQTIVQITNLPRKCTIKIYNLSGTLIRTYMKDSDNPSQNWDLKNASGTPVASGPYIIHVDGGDLGETIVKFMAIMPELDLNAF